MSSLRTPELMSGKYAQLFDIPVVRPNQKFVANPYLAGKCTSCTVTQFSLINGAEPCVKYTDNVLVWSNDGSRNVTNCYPTVKNGCNILQYQ